MSSLVSLVSKSPLRVGDRGEAVKALQLALGMAGYNSYPDGIFGEGTLRTLTTFQQQHNLQADGICGMMTAAALDLPHEVTSGLAKPIVTSSEFPHDDTASMVAFYGDPRSNNAAWQAANLMMVVPPWPMSYAGTPIKGISIHRKAASALTASLNDIWNHFGHDLDAIRKTGMHAFSGSYNLRAVRGSSRLSTHAFGAAIDMDAEHEAMNTQHISRMDSFVVSAFKAHGAYWGGDYNTRQDPMHFQWAHE